METKIKQPWFLEGFVARYKDIDFNDDYSYDYRLQILLDIHDYCIDNHFDILALLGAGYDEDEIIDKLFDLCYMSDCVTGNPSGSYWFSSWYAENALCHNWDLLIDALWEFDDIHSFDLTETSPEALDVKIRCSLLSECVHEYVSQIIACYVED